MSSAVPVNPPLKPMPMPDPAPEQSVNMVDRVLREAKGRDTKGAKRSNQIMPLLLQLTIGAARYLMRRDCLLRFNSLSDSCWAFRRASATRDTGLNSDESTASSFVKGLLTGGAPQAPVTAADASTWGTYGTYGRRCMAWLTGLSDRLKE